MGKIGDCTEGGKDGGLKSRVMIWFFTPSSAAVVVTMVVEQMYKLNRCVG